MAVLVIKGGPGGEEQCVTAARQSAPAGMQPGEVYLYGGSHGCVNTPKEAMKKIYDTINVDDHIPILVYTHQKPQTTN